MEMSFLDYIEEKNKFHFRRPKQKKFNDRIKRKAENETGEVSTDSMRKHGSNTIRSLNRLSLSQVPQKYRPAPIKGISNKTKKMVKAVKNSGIGAVKRITRNEVLEIATKYKFHVPTIDKPTKHLGSTGIEMTRKGPGIYFLIKTK